MYFSPLPCYNVPLNPKYSPNHPVLKHPQPRFLPQYDQVSHPYNSTGIITVLYIFNPLTPNYHYRGRTAPLTSKRCSLYIYATNICTEYFNIYCQCSHPTKQRTTTATNHIQQNQGSTPYAVTRSLFS